MLQDNRVPTSVHTLDTQLNLRSKTPKLLCEQNSSGLVLLKLFSPKTVASYFKLFDVQSCVCHCGMMSASTHNPDLTPVATAPLQGILAYFLLIKPQLCARPSSFFIKGINHGDLMEQENAAPCWYL